MKKVISKKTLILLSLLLLLPLFSGCFSVPPTKVAVTGVTLDQATMPLTAGGVTGTLVVTVAPANATNKSITWSSSAPAVASVVNGVVTPLTAGTTTITVTTVDGSFTATCAVTVTLKPVEVPTAPTVINIAAIPGVTPPVNGATPVTTITATAQYTGTVSWSPAAVTFAGGTVYTATIALTAKAGYTLSGVAANFFTVAGTTSDTNPASSGVVTAVFPAAPTVINIAAIPGVTAPVTGATPNTTNITTAQYTGTVSWLPADNPFKGDQVYTATITLTAKAGYTLSGVAANFFTVAGTTSDTNSANSGVVTAVFPATAAISATVGNVEIDGMVGSAITAKDVIITLANDTIAAEIAVNTDLAGWITNLPAGLTAKAKATVAAGATVVTIEISGTPTATLCAVMAIVIPHASLATSTSDLAVTANTEAKFAIVADILISPSTKTVTVGTPFTIDIVVENVTELQGVSVTLSFDDSKIAYTTAVAGAFLPAPIFFPPSAGSVTDQVTFTIAGTGIPPYSSGTGTVITVTFNPLAAGTTDISFDLTELRHDVSTPIPHKIKNECSVTVS